MVYNSTILNTEVILWLTLQAVKFLKLNLKIR